VVSGRRYEIALTLARLVEAREATRANVREAWREAAYAAALAAAVVVFGPPAWLAALFGAYAGFMLGWAVLIYGISRP
jgi:type IV secretory pathway TrbD component